MRSTWLALTVGLCLSGCLACRGQDDGPPPASGGPEAMRGPRGPHAGMEGVEARGPKGPEDMLGRVLENPKLTEMLGIAPEQAVDIRNAILRMKEKEIDLRAATEKAALRQAQLMTAKDIDEEAVLAVVDEIGRLRTEMARERMRNVIMIRRTLNPEQLEKAKSLMRERFEERAGKWRERQGEGAEFRERMKQQREHREREPQTP